MRIIHNRGKYIHRPHMPVLCYKCERSNNSGFISSLNYGGYSKHAFFKGGRRVKVKRKLGHYRDQRKTQRNLVYEIVVGCKAVVIAEGVSSRQRFSEGRGFLRRRVWDLEKSSVVSVELIHQTNYSLNLLEVRSDSGHTLC